MDCRRYRDAMYVQRSQRRHWVWMYQRRRPYNDNRQVWRQRRLDRWGQLGLEYISIGRTVVITMTMTTTRAVRSINGLKLQTSEPWKRMLKDLHINWPPIKIKKNWKFTDHKMPWPRAFVVSFALPWIQNVYGTPTAAVVNAVLSRNILII